MSETGVPEGSYGLMAEFESADDLMAAARQTFEAGYRDMDAYSPFPIEGLAETLGHPKPYMAGVVLAGILIGALLGFGMQYWISVIAYPMNVGGKPTDSWPAFMPVTFELAILVAALSVAIGMLMLNGLPKPYHPVFNVDAFQRASRDRFFLCIQATDDRYDQETTRQFLEGLDPIEVSDVPA